MFFEFIVQSSSVFTSNLFVADQRRIALGDSKKLFITLLSGQLSLNTYPCLDGGIVMSRIRKLQKRKSNPNLVKLIDEMLAKNKRIWKDVAERLAKPSKLHAEVNLSRLERYVSSEEIAIVPGKVLGGGELTKPVKVAALAFSDSARRKIEAAGGVCMSLREAMEIDAKFRIIG